ncbi:flagellar basal body P-ring formation chaperone FlgA [Puniceicoccaceae bacterium K14]|nr:flagellar basal body P-ring formation chaperone FlgA [Puniceicoccaceae bacterium K14]
MNKVIVSIILFFSPAGASYSSLDAILAPLPDPIVLAEDVAVSEESYSETTKVVEKPFFPITAADLREAISNELSDIMSPSTELTLIPLRTLPDLSNHSKPFSLRLISYPGRLSRANMLLRFQVENEKGLVGEYSAPFRAHLYSNVFYIQTNLKAGEIAAASDLEVRRADLLVESSAIPADPKQLERHEYSRNLNSGRVLQWADLTERSIIKKGEVVEVNAKSGLLAISTRAIARQNGVEGDFIVLRNLDSNKEFSGLVVSENKVQVKFR